MLKVDCNAVLNNNKSILIDSETVKELLNTLDTQYNGLDASVKARASIDTGTLRSMVSNELEYKISFLSKTVKELEEVMGESMDQLIKHNYSADIYEDKIIAFYADHWYKLDKKLETSQEAYSHFYTLDYLYDFWHEGHGMDDKLKLYLELRDFQEKFNYDRFGLNLDDVRRELLYIKEKRGLEEMNLIMNGLLNNCPDNFEDYDFHPENRVRSNGYYGFDPKTIYNYLTNSEIIEINGYEFDFAQVLPKDCTGIELLVYNFYKANVINTLRTLPDIVLEAASSKQSVFVLTCDKEAMSHKGGWGGYQDAGNGDVVFDAHGSLYDNDWMIGEVVLHELGHKFDDYLERGLFSDGVFGGKWYYTDNNAEWNSLFDKYKGIITSLTKSGYNVDNVTPIELFAEAIAVYYSKPDELKSFCPEVYELLSNLYGGDYGGAYTNNLDDVINTPFEGKSKGNGYPEPQNGPPPQQTPSPTDVDD